MIGDLPDRLVALRGARRMLDDPGQRIDGDRLIGGFAGESEEPSRVGPPVGLRLLGRLPFRFRFRLACSVECGPLSRIELDRKLSNRFHRLRSPVRVGAGDRRSLLAPRMPTGRRVS